MSHLSLLIWKNFKTKIRHPFVLILEIGLPCCFIMLLAYIRIKVKSDSISTPLLFEPFNIEPSSQVVDTFTQITKIFYAPMTDNATKLMEVFTKRTGIDPKQVIGFVDEEKMVSNYTALNSADVLCGIVLNNVSDTLFNVKLRFPFSPKQTSTQTFQNIDEVTWQTNRLFPLFQTPGARGGSNNQGGPPSYHEQHFLFIENALIDSFAKLNIPNYVRLEGYFSIQLQRMPYPPHRKDNYAFALQFFFPLILMLSFIYPSVNLAKNIVLEKEKRFTSMSSMMGLSASAHWLSHFLNAFIINMVSIVFMVIIMSIPLGDGNKVLRHSDPSLIMVWFALYNISCIMFCFMMSVFFNHANMAGVVTGTVFFLSFLPYYRLNLSYDSTPFFSKLALSFIFNTNMSLGAMLLSMWECKHVGMRWNHILESTSPDDELTVFALFCTSITNSVIYLLIALYVSNVFPGEYGIPQPWNYFLTWQYWFGEPFFKNYSNNEIRPMKYCNKNMKSTCPTRNRAGFTTEGWPSADSSTSDATQSKISVQKVLSAATTNIVLVPNKRLNKKTSTSREPFILTNIDKVSKSYDNGTSWAVHEFSMQMEENEITVLLGHNGAGKTTLMSMLCGIIPPTHGNITVFGKDYKKDIDEIRTNLGICPQFDVLFDDLTVREHLYFYCVLKQVPKTEINKEIKSMIEMLDLVPKTNALSSTLSGGMKRKLSVGIALIGGSKFVILDEPTSGMDVSARRHIWDLLLREKHNRSILLSTHFMEEADVLGDKIAILENGRLKCFGTPMELKKKYGLGYLLTITIKFPSPEIVKNIKDEVTTFIEDAKCLTQVGTEIIFSLQEKQKNHFKKLFIKLEQNSEKLKIMNFGISVTTIEEVFFRVGDFAQKGMQQFNEIAQRLQSNDFDDDEIIAQLRSGALVFNKGCKRLKQIFLAMFIKKLNFSFHNIFLLFAQFILPPVILILAIINNKDQNNVLSNSPELPFNLASYKVLNFIIFLEENPAYKQYYEMFKNIVTKAQLETATFQVHSINFDEKDFKENHTQQNDYLIEIGKENEIKYNLYDIFGLMIHANNRHGKYSRRSNSSVGFIGLFNNQAYHSAPTMLLLLKQLVLLAIQNTTDSRLSINFSNHPFPRTVSEGLSLLSFDSASEVQLCNALSFAVSFLLGSFIILIITEMISNFRHIQQISSLDTWVYWLTHFMLDYVFWIFSVIVLSLVIFCTGIEPFNHFNQAFYVFISLVVFGFAGLPYVYFLSFMASDPTTGYVRVSLLTVLIGVVSFIAVLLFLVPEFQLTNVSYNLEEILQFFIPIFTLQMQIFSIAKSEKALRVCNTTVQVMGKKTTFLELCDFPQLLLSNPKAAICCEGLCNNSCMIYHPFWEWKKPGSLQFIFGYFVQGFIYWTLLSMVELYGSKMKALLECFSTVKLVRVSEDLDVDVEQESLRITTLETNSLHQTDAMWVRNLRKNYGTFTAVNDISFGVKKAECFGILGVNGAGKTTTFKMITGAETITSGEIIINKMSVKTEMRDIYKIIGYCPQFNGLLEELTGRQTLRIISRIRGIHESMIDKQIDILAKLLYFKQNIDHQVYTYSGGTKRKLSVACSIVGNPMIVFLDEPSTGVDPISRRCLWNAIQALRSAGSSIVLTSHSMEECEALCNRLIIMVNAKVRCIGSTQHLKNKYGLGYIIEIKCLRRTKKKAILRLINHLERHFGQVLKLESNHNKLLTFRLATKEARLSELFGYIESLKQKEQYWIEDYSVHQTSLERVFLSFAQEQKEVHKQN